MVLTPFLSVDLKHIPVTSWMAWMTDMATGMGLASTRLKQAGMLVLLTCDKAWNEGKLQRNHTHMISLLKPGIQNYLICVDCGVTFDITLTYI